MNDHQLNLVAQKVQKNWREWDFRKIEPEERPMAVAWEYARELKNDFMLCLKKPTRGKPDRFFSPCLHPLFVGTQMTKSAKLKSAINCKSEASFLICTSASPVNCNSLITSNYLIDVKSHQVQTKIALPHLQIPKGPQPVLILI